MRRSAAASIWYKINLDDLDLIEFQMLISRRMDAGREKQRKPWRQLKAVEVAFNAEVAQFFRLYHGSDLNNQDISHNFVKVAAQFNTAVVKQV